MTYRYFFVLEQPLGPHHQDGVTTRQYELELSTPIRSLSDLRSAEDKILSANDIGPISEDDRGRFKVIHWQRFDA